MDKQTLIQWLIESPNVLLTRQHTKSFLMDFLESDKKQINLLMNAYDSNIISELRSKKFFSEIDKKKWMLKLSDDYSIMEEKAEWAIDFWTSILTIDVVSALEQAEIEQKESEQNVFESIETEMRYNTETIIDDYSEKSLMTKSDIDDSYYINPDLEVRKERIYISCGVGNTDFGFFIYGIKRTEMCNSRYGNVFAIVYNYLVRNSNITNNVIFQLEEYFLGRRKSFDIKIKPEGTEFQKRVWSELQKIHFGKTKSYAEIAAAIGDENAQRAVGSACNKNPIMIIIPCHRVICKNGKSGGFAYGNCVKLKLLESENKNCTYGMI